MRTVRTVRAMQALAGRCREERVTLGFVPTMGCLHAGHLSLVKRARQLVGPGGKVVVSVYVNPTQFGPAEDFSKYPRNLRRDAQLCRQAGVDFLFAPADAEMYQRKPGEEASTSVVEERLARCMEGAARPTHFRGVTTVVAKLLHIVDPGVAIFGAKDFQQAAVIKRMVRDLNLSARIVVAPTFREADGLAKSSRNQYLSGPERTQAIALWRVLQLARRLVRSRVGGWPAEALRKEMEDLLKDYPLARMEYISFFDPLTLEPATIVRRGTQVALAVFMGKTRLIDNTRL